MSVYDNIQQSYKFIYRINKENDFTQHTAPTNTQVEDIKKEE